MTLVVLAVSGGATWFYFPKIKLFLFPGKSSTVAPPERIVPVVAATAKRGDMELHLNSLGTVAGFNTVTIRSRVEGELLRVAFTEGQMVKEGELLAEIDPRPFEVQLREAEAQQARDEAAARVASSDYDRYKLLANTKTITPQELGAAKALYEQNAATVDADRSRVDNIKLQLQYCKITSPINGRIGLRTVDKGNIVRANDVTGLAVVTQLQPISVVFSIPQDEIPRLQKKMKATSELVVDAYARDFETKIASGTVMAVDNQVDSTTGTVRIKAKFENTDNSLFPNQFVNARLGVQTLPGVIIVPSAGVQRGPDFSYVYIVKEDSTVELRKVEAGPTEGDQTAVFSGLEPGEVIVIDGVDKLTGEDKQKKKKGTKVSVKQLKGAGKGSADKGDHKTGGPSGDKRGTGPNGSPSGETAPGPHTGPQKTTSGEPEVNAAQRKAKQAVDKADPKGT